MRWVKDHQVTDACDVGDRAGDTWAQDGGKGG